jgi:death-on-curing protein
MSEPVWIDAALVLAIHDRVLAEHGVAEGLRDESLLHSALARAPDHFAYSGAETVELAAKYTTAIVKNHPFLDGSKRTGFVVGALFLELNGFHFTASEEAAAQAVIELAAGALDEDGFSGFLRTHIERA